MIRTILAAYDDSDSARSGLDTGARIAAATGARLLVAHVVTPLRRERAAESVGEVLEGLTRDRCEEWEDKLVEAAESARSTVGDAAEVETRLLVGSPVTRLVEVAEEESVDLLIAGTQGIGHIKQVLLGSVSQRLLENARCDLLFTREPLPGSPPPTVVVGCDGSDWARRAVDIGQELAGAFGSSLVLTHVAGYPAPFADSTFLSEESREGMRKDLHEHGVQILHEFRERVVSPVADVVEDVREGHVRGEMFEAIEERRPAIAVVGTRGTSGFSELLIGSVTRDLLDYSRSPVLVTRLPGHPADPA